MRNLIARTVITLAVFALAGVGALAGGKKDRVDFRQDFEVNGTTVEKGSYDVSFDKEAGELSIIKGGKVIAKSKARAEQSESKNKYTAVRVSTESGRGVLRSISIAGDRQTVVLGEGGGASAGGTQ